ncbi:MAG TPA: lipoate-protein ligase A, partial [Raoultella sp.]|nr:lipoate-protein ligase A [Raoultella sp.]
MNQHNRAACWPQRFIHQQLPLQFHADPTLAELPLFERARGGEALAQL